MSELALTAEELLAWLQLPALLTIAQQPVAQQPAALAKLEDAAAEAIEVAQSSGYNLDLYLASIPPTFPKPAPSSSEPVPKDASPKAGRRKPKTKVEVPTT